MFLHLIFYINIITERSQKMKRQGNLEKNQNNRNVEVKDLKYRPNRLSEDELKNVFGGVGSPRFSRFIALDGSRSFNCPWA